MGLENQRILAAGCFFYAGLLIDSKYEISYNDSMLEVWHA